MADFVLDCSVTMSWLFKDEVTAATLAVLNRLDLESAIVPELWFLEVANVLLVAERKKRVDETQATDFLNQLLRLQIEVDGASSRDDLIDLLMLSRSHNLTAYDAVYLELASRLKLPLATLDDPLRKAARKLGVPLLGK